MAKRDKEREIYIIDHFAYVFHLTECGLTKGLRLKVLEVVLTKLCVYVCVCVFPQLFRSCERSLKRIATVGNDPGAALAYQERVVRLNVMRSLAGNVQSLSKEFRAAQKSFLLRKSCPIFCLECIFMYLFFSFSLSVVCCHIFLSGVRFGRSRQHCR